MLLIALGTVAAGTASADGPGGAAPRRVTVGHGGLEYFNPAAKRFSGVVVALGAPDAQGRILSFRLAAAAPNMPPPAPNAMVGWRLTVLGGARYASAYEVRSNTETEVTVVLRDRPLNGLAARDFFVVDEPDPKSPWADDLGFGAKPS